ncbi:MAG: acyltransferase [Bacteroidales bacterium]|nr:acyltransferase [Bacteroidales bacterium]
MPFDIDRYRKEIFTIRTAADFERLSLQAFYFQYMNNPVYRKYCDLLYIDAGAVNYIADIPFMPVEFFKTHKVLCDGRDTEVIFTSSSTTGAVPSSHYVADADLYRKAFTAGFQQFYGEPSDFCILGLLPAYLERSGSSLVYMVDELVRMSDDSESGFFLHNHDELYDTICSLEKRGRKYILIGVSFALLDFAERYKLNMQHGIVMETGGMKGRRKEMVRSELHSVLMESFGVHSIHSEYGMTELLSQAYSQGDGIYSCSRTMKVLVREPNDPLAVHTTGSGAINVVDLANIYSCSFLQTSDLGQVFDDGSFSVSGRFDSADVRGCNLMVV